MTPAIQKYLDSIRKTAAAGGKVPAATQERLRDALEEVGVIDIVGHVESFMRACDLTLDRPNDQQALLYWKLIEEEMRELEEASFIDEDGTAELDGIVDLIWVLIGFAFSNGHDIRGAMREVARSNMDKIMPGGKVLKRADGKVLKPEGWKPPQLGEFAGY